MAADDGSPDHVTRFAMASELRMAKLRAALRGPTDAEIRHAEDQARHDASMAKLHAAANHTPAPKESVREARARRAAERCPQKFSATWSNFCQTDRNITQEHILTAWRKVLKKNRTPGALPEIDDVKAALKSIMYQRGAIGFFELFDSPDNTEEFFSQLSKASGYSFNDTELERVTTAARIERNAKQIPINTNCR